MDNQTKIIEFINSWKSILKATDLEKIVDILQATVDEQEQLNLKDRQAIRHNNINDALGPNKTKKTKTQ
tara:strand:+ start:376 stop:582 length:207 start_codon:yes stop_codon:yes gene_type:complete